MTNLELQIELWHDRRFGKTVDVPATYRKLLEEIGELGEAIMQEDAEAIREEAGDIAFILTHIVRACCPDHPSLFHAMDMVLNKNIERVAKQKKKVKK